jgi:hypothetical protein
MLTLIWYFGTHKYTREKSILTLIWYFGTHKIYKSKIYSHFHLVLWYP